MPAFALVTGASSGLGRELVRQLVRDRGMTVLATARRRDRLEALAAEFPPGRILIEPGDLAESAFRQRLWERAEAFAGGVDLLVNNAGLGNYSEFSVADFQKLERLFEVNVIALMDLTQRGVRHMRARGGGQVLQISSVLGFVGLPYSAAYVASKHAVNGLVKSLRYELRGTGVRVWAACPGRTESEFSNVALGDATVTDRVHRGASTEKVVRAIVRGLDSRSAFRFPNVSAWAVVAASQGLPGPFDWIMSRFALGRIRGELDRARGSP
jgi:short-subunit dehydrogenase